MLYEATKAQQQIVHNSFCPPNKYEYKIIQSFFLPIDYKNK